MIRNYLKNAWRSTWRNKTTAIINIAGLSVGMTAAVLILLWVQNETSFDNYKDIKNIYRLTTRIPSLGWVWETSPLLLGDAIKNDVPGIEKTTKLYTNGLPVFKVKGSLFYEKNCAYVDNDWFDFFHYRFIEGNAASFNEHPFSVVLSSSEARKYFGESSPVGQTIHIDSADYKVCGVVEDPPVNSSFQYNAFIPIAALLTNPQQKENDMYWGNDNYVTFIKILPTSNPASIARQISAIRKSKSHDDEGTVMSMIPLGRMHFENEVQHSAFVHGNRNTVYIFSFLGFLLLLIACVNYVNLTTAKASLRAKEISIRKITGANRSSLFIQFITESVFISLLSLIATMILVQLCLLLFSQLTGKAFVLPLSSLSLWKVLGITLVTAVLLNSIYPALLLSSFKPLQVFRGATVLMVKDSSFRKSLVVLQFTISIILIAGTIVIYKQMRFVQNNDPGYNRSQVITFRMPEHIDRANRASLVTAIKHDLLAYSSIESVAAANQPLTDIGSTCSGCADWAGHDTSYNPKIAQLSADADFQKTMQLKMKEGRWFSDNMGTDRKSVILNETAVKDFNLQKPVIGQRFIFKGDTGQVIGVVKNFTYKSMREKTGPLVVFNNPTWRSQFVVRSAAKSSMQALADGEKIWKKYFPATPFEYVFLDDIFNNLYKQDRQTSFLILVFAVIAVVISALGLFSLAAFEAAQRTKEIGIRKVLGASIAGIAALLSKDFVKLVLIAILIASPLAWWAMNKWLQDFAYRIDISWWMFAAAGLLAMLIALFTISFQSIRAALANAVESLRTE